MKSAAMCARIDERRYNDVAAGPLAEQDCEATQPNSPTYEEYPAEEDALKP